MTAPTLPEIAAAVRGAWSVDTCDPVDVNEWSPENPARGQCGVTTLVLHDLLGGELLVAEVHYADGSRQGYHYWNRLPDGVEIDLTVEQFASAGTVQEPQVVVRASELPKRCVEQYLLLRHRVNAALAVSRTEAAVER